MPCYSGLSLSALEADESILQVHEALLQLSRHCANIIVWSLCQILDKLQKVRDHIVWLYATAYAPAETCRSRNELGCSRVLGLHTQSPYTPPQLPLEHIHRRGQFSDGTVNTTFCTAQIPCYQRSHCLCLC